MKKKKVASEKAETAPIVRYRQSISYDENGDIISSVLYRPHYENGSGFMLCYMSNIDELVLNVKQPSILRAFFHIAANQQYGNSGVFGYRCSKKHLQDVLGIQRPTLWAAINWLKDNFLINETQVDGVFEYMVNPEILTIGKSKKFRVAEWNRRCQDYIKKLESKKTDNATNAPDSSSNSEVVSG